MALQRKEDPTFPANWVLDDHPVDVAADIPRRLVVKQLLDRALNVKEYGPDWERETSYEIGATTASGDRSRTEVGWHGDYLSIDQRTLLPSGATAAQRKQMWRFDDGRRLVISFYADDKQQGTRADRTLSYRRDSQ